MKFFDAHSHLNFSQYDDDCDAVLACMEELGVGTITVGTNIETSKEAVQLAREHENIWASVGVHPTEAGETDFSAIKELVGEPGVVAVGECGLDYFHKPYDEEVQTALFLKHLVLSQEVGLPLIIHCRDAYGDLLSVIQKREISDLQGVMHFFAGTPAQARQFLDLGMYVSFAGPVTFTDEYDKVIETVPLEQLLIETDAPFAAPTPHRGKRNEPAYVVEVAKKIASVKGVAVDKVAKQTLENAQKLFQL